VFEFADSVFDDLMGVIAFEVVENDWECATCEIEFAVVFVTKSAAKLASDVTVVANFLVFCGVECHKTL